MFGAATFSGESFGSNSSAANAAAAPGATLTGTSTILAGAATGGAAGSAPGATLTGNSTISAGAATGGGSVAAAAPGATLTGVSSISAGQASAGVLVANANQMYVGRGRIRNYPGSAMSFSPIRAGAEEIFTVDFATELAPGESISTPVWTMVPVDAVDPNAGTMILGLASITGTQVSQMISAKLGGIPGIRYAPKCTVKTNSGETLVLPEYGMGQLEVTL